MTLTDIQEYKIFETMAGSHAYGLATPESDIDIRGIFRLPSDAFLSMIQPPKQVGDQKSDIIFYELRRYLELAVDCNPNIIELLWSPEDCIRYRNKAMETILEKRSLFVSKKAFHTFSGYAYSQVKRAKGRNKWVNNPKPKEPPEKEDFCYIIPDESCVRECSEAGDNAPFPCRPVPLRELLREYDLRKFHCAAVEHTPNLYRLYEYGELANGVFRNGQLVCESIPISDERVRFRGLLIYNEQEYERALKDWKNYWDWYEHRNAARYLSQERGEIDYDAKNMMHCMRLLWSGRNILENSEPIVRFAGEQRQRLIDIRAGKYAYQELMAWVEQEMAALENVKDKSALPKGANIKQVDRLYKALMADGMRES